MDLIAQKNLKTVLGTLEEVLFDETKVSQQFAIVQSIISSDLILNNVELVSEFGRIIKDVFNQPDREPLFDKVVEKLLVIHKTYGKEALDNWQKIADTIIDLLLYKSVQSDAVCESDIKTMYRLYGALLKTYPANHKPEYWISIIEGFANCALSLGKNTRDKTILRQSLNLYEKALNLYKTHTFPKHWQLSNMIAGTQIALVQSVIEAYQVSNVAFAADFKKAGDLLEKAIDTFLISGTDFNLEISDALQQRYNEMKSSL